MSCMYADEVFRIVDRALRGKAGAGDVELVRHSSIELSPLAISYILLALYFSLLLLAFTFCANSNAISFNIVSQHIVSITFV